MERDAEISFTAETASRIASRDLSTSRFIYVGIGRDLVGVAIRNDIGSCDGGK